MEFVKKHNRVALAAAKVFASEKPWQGNFAERAEKLRVLHADLLGAYDVAVDLVIDTEGGNPDNANGFVSFEAPATTIVLRPGFAIMTYLRLFAEAMDEERTVNYGGYDAASYAARWANGLFKKAFPKSWDKLVNRDAPILTRNYA